MSDSFDVTHAALDDLLRSDSVLRHHVDGAAAIGAATARAMTKHWGGTLEFVASVGTRLTMTFPAADPASRR